MNYKDQLKHPQWQRKRLEILNRDDFTCQYCEDKETELHVHHKIYKNGKKAWEYPLSDYVSMCSYCHESIHIIKDTFGKIDYNKLLVRKMPKWATGEYQLVFLHKELFFVFTADPELKKIIAAYVLSHDKIMFIKNIIDEYLKTNKDSEVHDE